MTGYKLKNPSVVPPTGYVYTQPETGARLNGNGMRETTMLMIRHREANGLPRATFDECDEDLQTQICKTLGPQWCDHAERWGFNMSFDTIAAGSRTLFALAKARLTGGDAYVSQAEAERRAAICAKCFLNQRSPGCFSCATVNVMQQLVSETQPAGQATSKDGQLFACAPCGCLLTHKVWVAPEVLKAGLTDRLKEVYAETPGCWVAEL